MAPKPPCSSEQWRNRRPIIVNFKDRWKATRERIRGLRAIWADRYRPRFDRVILWLLFSLLGTFLILWRALPANTTIFELDARTEVLTFRVTNPAAAAFGLDEARVLGETGGCFSHLWVKPQFGARITYLRDPRGKAVILIAGEAVLNGDDDHHRGRPRSLRMPEMNSIAQIVLGPQSNCFPSIQFLRLPVNGNGFEAGRELEFYNGDSRPPLVLLSGHLRLFVQGIHFRKGGLLERLQGLAGIKPYILFVADELTVPGGTTVKTTPQDRDRGNPDWWGFADLDFGDHSARGIAVNAWSAAGTAQVTFPAAPAPSLSDAAQNNQLLLSLTTAERFVGDPTIRFLAPLLTLFLVVFGILASLAGSLREGSR